MANCIRLYRVHALHYVVRVRHTEEMKKDLALQRVRDGLGK